MAVPITQNQQSKEPPNFSWCVDGLLSACAFPRSKEHIQFLVDNGIETLVSLTEERKVKTHGLDIKVVSLPIREFRNPTLQQAEEFLEVVKTSKNLGKGVCVHCNGGLGRTGTLLACYFAQEKFMSPQEAIDHVRTLRPWSIENLRQESFVSEFMKSKPSSTDF